MQKFQFCIPRSRFSPPRPQLFASFAYSERKYFLSIFYAEAYTTEKESQIFFFLLLIRGIKRESEEWN